MDALRIGLITCGLMGTSLAETTHSSGAEEVKAVLLDREPAISRVEGRKVIEIVGAACRSIREMREVTLRR
ncbi:MAG: hypothetical protein V1800_02200 [Candidatus Latescibacterota bacterium]